MRHGRAVLGAVATVAVAVAAPAASAGTSTTWPGWDLASGDAAGLVVGDDERFAVRGTTLLRIATVPDADTGAVTSWFLLQDPEGTRVGSLPWGWPTVAAADRLLLVDGCTVRRSVDRGATWAATRLDRCVPGGSTGPVERAQFADRDHGLVVAPSGIWGTDDGGARWVRRGDGRVAGRPLLLGPTVALRVVAVTPTTYGLTRSVDGGASWNPVPLPVAAASAGAPGGTSVALPSLSAPARRADGAVVLGTTGAVLTSGDGGASFVRTALPERVGGATAVVGDIVCEPAVASCLLPVGQGPSAFTVRFQDDTVGSVLPALPNAAVSPLPGVVLGTLDSPPKLRRSVDGGVSYAQIGGRATRVPVTTRRMIALRTGNQLRISIDAGEEWVTLPVPDAPGAGAIRELARIADGAYLALTDAGLHRYAEGRWSLLSSLDRVGARSLARLGDDVLAVGRRGIVRVAADGRVRPVSAPVLAGRSYTGIEVRGRQVVAWSARQVVRSTDGGRRWRTVRGPVNRGVDDLQLLGAKRYVAIDGGRVYRSTADGRRLVRFGAVPPIATRGRPRGLRSSLAFVSATRGVLRTGDGAFRTTDGGRRVEALPLPPAADPGSAIAHRRGVAVSLAASNVVVRTERAGTTTAPTLVARRVGRVMRRSRTTRRVVISGRLRGAPASARVRLVSSRGRTEPGRWRGAVTVNADGTFRQAVVLSAGERLVRAWYRGQVTSASSVPGASSSNVRVPAWGPSRR